jgi:hypothetical protein
MMHWIISRADGCIHSTIATAIAPPNIANISIFSPRVGEAAAAVCRPGEEVDPPLFPSVLTVGVGWTTMTEVKVLTPPLARVVVRLMVDVYADVGLKVEVVEEEDEEEDEEEEEEEEEEDDVVEGTADEDDVDDEEVVDGGIVVLGVELVVVGVVEVTGANELVDVVVVVAELGLEVEVVIEVTVIEVVTGEVGIAGTVMDDEPSATLELAPSPVCLLAIFSRRVTRGASSLWMTSSALESV